MNIHLSKCKNESERETATLFINLGLKIIELGWRFCDKKGEEIGEIDGIFLDEKNEFYIIYDDSKQEQNRQEKITKFLSKWSEKGYQNELRKELQLLNYPIYIFYIDKCGKKSFRSIEYLVDNNRKIMWSDDFNYFSKLNKHIGSWVKNDIYNYYGIKKKGSKKYSINAIQFYVGETPAFVYAHEVDKILEYSYISRKRGEDKGYQRMIVGRKLKEIEEFIKENESHAFPNSILLNCVESVGGKLLSKENCPDQIEIDLPESFSSCRIVDGQHRLLGFSKLDHRIQKSHTLPVVLFSNMSSDQEIKTFIEVNNNQKPIDKNLIYILKSGLNWPTDSKEYIEKICVKITEMLNINSFLKNTIYFGTEGEEKKGKLTLLTVVDNLLKNKIVSNDIGVLQKNINDVNTPYSELRKYFDIIKKESTTEVITFHKTNLGFKLILRFITLLKLNIKSQSIKINFEDGIKLYANVVNMKKEDLDTQFGEGGVNVAFELIISELIKKDIRFKKFINDFRKLKI